MNDLEKHKFWYEEPSHAMPSALFKYLTNLSTLQSSRQELNRRHLKLYGNYDILGLNDQYFTGLLPIDRLTLNVVAMNIDTATARIAKNRPRPKVLTDGGDEPMRRQAMKLEKFMGGTMYQTKANQAMQRMFRSACVFGDGFVKTYSENGKIQIGKKFTPNIVVDEQEALYNDPQCMYEIYLVNRHILARKYPKQAQAIMEAETDSSGWFSVNYAPDQVIVVHAFKKASEDGKDDGLNLLCTSSCNLDIKKYTRTRFPYTKFGYQPKEIGFFSEGISEMLTNHQFEINKSLRVVQVAIQLCAPKLMIEANSDVNLKHLNNEIGSALYYTGTMPTWSTIVGVPADIREHIEWNFEKSFQRTGLSNLSAFGEKPANISSGKGMREYNDIETERFAVISQNYEQSYIDLWTSIIDAAEDEAANNKKFQVVALDKNNFERINWKDISMEKDSYIMQTYPSSFLSKNPSARYDEIKELMDIGLVDRETALDLLQFPDLESYYNEANSPRRNIMTVISNIVDKGEYYPPTPYQNLKMGIPVMNNFMLFYQDRKLEPEKIELFARWISEAQALSVPPQPKTDQEVTDELDFAEAADAIDANAGGEQMPMDAAMEQALAEEQQAQIPTVTNQ